jgi:CRISPR-associated protein Cas2
MASDSKWWLVCYDIRDPRRLRRAAKKLEGFGHRMQYSVFRCWMSLKKMQQLRWELTEELKAEDSVLMIPLCEQCVAGLETTHSASKKVEWPEQPKSFEIA